MGANLVFTKRNNESTGSLLRRFGRSAMSSVVKPGKAKKAHVRKLSRREENRRARMKVALQQLRRRLQRQGKNEDFQDEKTKLKRTIQF